MDSNLDYQASDYLAVLRRRRKILAAFAVPIVVGAALLSLLLPDNYTSWAHIDMNLEGSKVRTLEPIEITTYADQYIADLTDRALIPDNIVELANDPEVFPDDRSESAELDRIGKILNSVQISPLIQVVNSPTSGREVELTSGIRVEANGTDPKFVFHVSKYVTELFLDADRELRTARATSTSIFLSEQMNITELEILDLEQQIADFKVENACCLPELVTLNMSAIQRAEREMENTQPRIRSLEQDRAFLKVQLEEIEQLNATTDRMEELEQEYMTLVANYGPDHPDVNRVRREIIAIAGASASGDEALEIIELRMKLREAEQKYSNQHPDVIRYRNQLAVMEAGRRSSDDIAQNQLLDNPRYLQIRAELNSINTQLVELRTGQPKLRQKIEEYEDRLARTPQIESEYQALNRKLESARDNFEDLQRRSVIARQTQALESTEFGARLVQIVPATLPRGPSGPPRLALAIIGVILGGALGVGSMLFAELTDHTVRGGKDILATAELVPLVLVPVIQNSVSKARQQRQTYLLIGASVILVAATLAIFIYHNPLFS